MNQLREIVYEVGDILKFFLPQKETEDKQEYAPITHVFAYAKGSLDDKERGPLGDKPEYWLAVKEATRNAKLNGGINRRNFWRGIVRLPAIPRLEINVLSIYDGMIKQKLAIRNP